MKRRDFIGLAASAATAAATGDNAPRAGGSQLAATANPNVPPRNRRPYSDVDWSKVVEVHTTSHGHCENQKMLDAYLDRGFEFLTISNYYPSAPTMPLKTFHDRHYYVHHE